LSDSGVSLPSPWAPTDAVSVNMTTPALASKHTANFSRINAECKDLELKLEKLKLESRKKSLKSEIKQLQTEIDSAHVQAASSAAGAASKQDSEVQLQHTLAVTVWASSTQKTYRCQIKCFKT